METAPTLITTHPKDLLSSMLVVAEVADVLAEKETNDKGHGPRPIGLSRDEVDGIIAKVLRGRGAFILDSDDGEPLNGRVKVGNETELAMNPIRSANIDDLAKILDVEIYGRVKTRRTLPDCHAAAMAVLPLTADRKKAVLKGFRAKIGCTYQELVAYACQELHIKFVDDEPSVEIVSGTDGANGMSTGTLQALTDKVTRLHTKYENDMRIILHGAMEGLGEYFRLMLIDKASQMEEMRHGGTDKATTTFLENVRRYMGGKGKELAAVVKNAGEDLLDL